MGYETKAIVVIPSCLLVDTFAKCKKTSVINNKLHDKDLQKDYIFIDSNNKSYDLDESFSIKLTFSQVLLTFDFAKLGNSNYTLKEEPLEYFFYSGDRDVPVVEDEYGNLLKNNILLLSLLNI